MLAENIIIFLTGFILGAAAIGLLLRRKNIELSDKLDATQKRVEEHLLELSENAARIGAAEEKAGRVSGLEDELKTAGREINSLTSEKAELATSLEKEMKASQEKLKMLDEAETRLLDTFRALSAEALKSNNQSFLELAKSALETFHENAKGDLEKRQQAITSLVKPISESLEKVDAKINDLEKARSGAYATLTEQVRSLMETGNRLRLETSGLVKALRSPKTRGTWGELQLKRVVEMAGMVDRCDFFEQKSADSHKGRLVADMLIRLPADKYIVVDAKTPWEAYSEAVNMEDEQKREAKLADIVRQISDHIKKLSEKKYWEQFQPAPEFVVLFLPIEALFSVALEFSPDLIETGVRQNVILATPTTLISLLRAVAYGWREEGLARNAKEISDLGRELFKRMSTMGEHIAKLGRSIKSSVESYNDTIGSLESRVMPAARRLKELKAAPDNHEIEKLEQIDQVPRKLHVLEMNDAQNNEEND